MSHDSLLVSQQADHSPSGVAVGITVDVAAGVAVLPGQLHSHRKLSLPLSNTARVPCGVGVRVSVGVGPPGVGVTLGVGVIVGVMVPVGVMVGVCVGVVVPVGDGVQVTVFTRSYASSEYRLLGPLALLSQSMIPD